MRMALQSIAVATVRGGLRVARSVVAHANLQPAVADYVLRPGGSGVVMSELKLAVIGTRAIATDLSEAIRSGTDLSRTDRGPGGHPRCGRVWSRPHRDISGWCTDALELPAFGPDIVVPSSCGKTEPRRHDSQNGVRDAVHIDPLSHDRHATKTPLPCLAGQYDHASGARGPVLVIVEDPTDRRRRPSEPRTHRPRIAWKPRISSPSLCRACVSTCAPATARLGANNRTVSSALLGGHQRCTTRQVGGLSCGN
jgi:hypothetical protein